MAGIQLKYETGNSTDTPINSDISRGELILNTQAGLVWYGDNSGNVAQFKITTLDATANRTFYSDGSGNVTELAHGSTSGHVLTSNGSSSAPSWQEVSGGGGDGDITAVVAGDGLQDGGTSGSVTLNIDVSDFAGTGLSGDGSENLNVDASQTQITSVGTIGTGVWQGTAVASAYLDSDTAHLSTTQTFSGAKTFSSLTSFTMDGNTITGVDDSDEHTNDDAHIMTSAAVEDKILSYSYVNTKAQVDNFAITEVGSVTVGEWAATDVAVSHGGTGVSTLTDGGVLLGSGTGAITAMAVLSDGQMIVGDGSGDPVPESGATLRTSIGCNPVTGSSSITTLGTIGTGVWNGTAIASSYIAGDAITGAKIADDAVDSEHLAADCINSASFIADDVIDTEHIADDAIEEEQIGAGEVKTAAIADNAVTLAKMAGLDRGHIIYGDSSGNPASLANSTTDGHVLTVQNANGDIGWEAASGGGGGGDIDVSGTPADGQVAVWTDADTLEGDAQLTFNTSVDQLIVPQIGQGAADTYFDMGTTNNTFKFHSDDGTARFSMSSVGIVPETNNNVDLGTTSLRWKNGWFAGNIVLDGSVTGGSGQYLHGLAVDQGAAVHGINVSAASGVGQITYFNPFSDSRLKTDVSEFNYGLAEIKQLNTKYYKYDKTAHEASGLTLPPEVENYPDNYYGRENYGLMADNVKSVMPKAVSLLEEDKDYETYDKDVLIYALINSVKELETRIATLEAA